MEQEHFAIALAIAQHRSMCGEARAVDLWLIEEAQGIVNGIAAKLVQDAVAWAEGIRDPRLFRGAHPYNSAYHFLTWTADELTQSFVMLHVGLFDRPASELNDASVRQAAARAHIAFGAKAVGDLQVDAKAVVHGDARGWKPVDPMARLPWADRIEQHEAQKNAVAAALMEQLATRPPPAEPSELVEVTARLSDLLSSPDRDGAPIVASDMPHAVLTKLQAEMDRRGLVLACKNLPPVDPMEQAAQEIRREQGFEQTVADVDDGVKQVRYVQPVREERKEPTTYFARPLEHEPDNDLFALAPINSKCAAIDLAQPRPDTSPLVGVTRRRG